MPYCTCSSSASSSSSTIHKLSFENGTEPSRVESRISANEWMNACLEWGPLLCSDEGWFVRSFVRLSVNSFIIFDACSFFFRLRACRHNRSIDRLTSSPYFWCCCCCCSTMMMMAAAMRWWVIDYIVRLCVVWKSVGRGYKQRAFAGVCVFVVIVRCERGGTGALVATTY